MAQNIDLPSIITKIAEDMRQLQSVHTDVYFKVAGRLVDGKQIHAMQKTYDDALVAIKTFLEDEDENNYYHYHGYYHGYKIFDPSVCLTSLIGEWSTYGRDNYVKIYACQCVIKDGYIFALEDVIGKSAKQLKGLVYEITSECSERPLSWFSQKFDEIESELERIRNIIKK